MMKAGFVTTIIPVYNRPDMLRESVASVLKQSYRPINIVIVNDGSDDNTPDVADALAQQHGGIIKVLHVENGGPGRAREHGLLAADGEFIQYLDSDDRLLPSKFATQVKALQQNPDCGVAYGKTRLIDEQGGVLVAPFKRSGERIDYLFPGLLVDRWWNTHTPLYRRSVCDQIGRWSDMRMGEDWEYDARIGALGTKLVFCNEYVSEHRQHTQSRLTGSYSHGVLRDFGRLMPVLFECAQQAGVEIGCAEMQHFSRWAFSLARQLGYAGENTEAKVCFEISRQADRNGGKGLQYRACEVLSAVVGWRFVGIMSHLVDVILRRKPSIDTLQQSWM